MLKTETPSSAHPDLDLYELPQLVSAFIEDQVEAVDAVRRAGPQLAAAVAAALPRIQAGGRLLYAGAGTSGRLGVLDSVELYPTTGTSSDVFHANGKLAITMEIGTSFQPSGTPVGMKNHLSPLSMGPIRLGASALTCQYMMAGPWRWACAPRRAEPGPAVA